MKRLSIASVGVMLALGAFSARADDFKFSFEGLQVRAFPQYEQAVSGEIFGLGDNGFFSPDHVTVDMPGFNFSSSDPATVFSGGFQVANGQIVASNFTANSGELGCGSGCGLRLTDTGNSANFGSGNFVIDGSGSPATFTPVNPPVSAAPEPDAWLLMLTGVGLLGLYLRRSKRPQMGLPLPA